MDFDNPYATDEAGTNNMNSFGNKLPDFSKISKISKDGQSNFTLHTKLKDQLGPVEPIKEEKPGDDEDDKNKANRSSTDDSVTKKEALEERIEELSKVEVFFDTTFNTFVYKFRYIIIILGLLMAGYAGVRAYEVQGLT